MITSLQNERVKEAYKIKKGHQKFFILEDEDLLLEALKKDLVKEIFYTSPKYLLPNIDCCEVTPSIISKLSNLSTPGDFIAICKHFDNPLKGNLVIALDGIQDPGNAGTILRSALAFSFEEMLLSSNSIDIYNDKFIRSTKGAYFHLPIHRLNLKEELERRKKEGYKVIVLDLDEKASTIDKIKRTDKMIVVVGSEGQGISKEIKALGDIIAYIPISKDMESLNAGVAATIAMYELNKK